MKYKVENLFPFFQPVISIENNDIYGFEVLGRYNDNDNIISLGDFFCNPDNDKQYVLEVDRIIREKAIKKFAMERMHKQKLFINIKPEWIEPFASKPDEMPTLKLLRKYNIDFSDVVIEINEQYLDSLNDSIMYCISYYKSIGIKIAIDDYGKDSSNIFRLATILPDMIKIDMVFIQRSENMYQYKNYLTFITDYCHKLGIEVVYEGIETDKQLVNCINASGRYYQGFFLSKPQPEIKNNGYKQAAFKNSLISFIINYQKHNVVKEKTKKEIDSFVDICIRSNAFGDMSDIDENIMNLKDSMPQYIIRIYICNKYGFQVSSNIEFQGETIELIDNHNKNWAWRNYFKNAIDEITDDKSSYMTHAYRDIATKDKIYTYVSKINDTIYLFADISESELFS